MAKMKHLKKCKALQNSLFKKVYFPAAFPIYQQALDQLAAEQRAAGKSAEEAEKAAARLILSQLHDVMRDAQPAVDQLIEKRIAAKKIQDVAQARKNAAGNVFQQLFAYTVAQNVILGNITKPVAVTTSASSLLKQYASIHVGDDVLTPDSDVLIYAPDADDSPIMNFSCKTSCRERAGQTYKWKLLCDLATCQCQRAEGMPNCLAARYHLTYKPTHPIITCFVTADFYDEICNPQISAMFRFFDHSYLAKPIPLAKGVQALDCVIDTINRTF